MAEHEPLYVYARTVEDPMLIIDPGTVAVFVDLSEAKRWDRGAGRHRSWNYNHDGSWSLLNEADEVCALIMKAQVNPTN